MDLKSNSKVDTLEEHLKNQTLNASEGIDFFWHKLRSRFVIKAIEKYFENGKTVNIADIGAGAGILGYHLNKEKKKWKYFFYEPIQQLSENLVHKFGIESKILNMQLTQIDLVTLLDVLEHQKDDVDFLKNIHKEMKNDSYILITVPAFQMLWSKWDEKLGHYKRYNRSSLKKVIKTAGFSVVETRYLFQAMFFAGLLRKSLPPKGTEFPSLGRFINRSLFLLGVIEQTLFSPFLPFGSSIAIVGKK